MSNNVCFELLEIIDRLKEDIEKKDKLIKKLVMDNAEKENLINELMKGDRTHTNISEINSKE